MNKFDKFRWWMNFKRQQILIKNLIRLEMLLMAWLVYYILNFQHLHLHMHVSEWRLRWLNCLSLSSKVYSTITSILLLFQGSYPEPLLSADNSVVCTDASKSMLTKLFNITPSIVRPISFPSETCKTARNRCDQCLANGRCIFSGNIMHANHGAC